jgi:Fe-S-cluster containining protein
MECRPGCGACCIAQSISSAIPGMPEGKPAGMRCIQLSDDNLCLLYGDPRRPRVCIQFQAMPDVCGSSREEAMRLLAQMELDTAPEADDRPPTTDDK